MSAASAIGSPTAGTKSLYLNPMAEVWIQNDIIKDPITIQVELDLDFMADQFTVSLENTDGGTLYKYKKYDTIQIWAGYDKADTIIFTGVIEKIKPTANNSGTFVTYTGKNLGYLLMQRNAFPRSYSSRDVKDVVTRMLRDNFTGETFGSQSVITLLTAKLKPIPLQLLLQMNKSDTIAKGLTKIKERVAYEIWIEPAGYLRIEPLSILIKNQVPAVELIYGENLIAAEIDDIANRINTIEVYGLRPTDYAKVQDPVALQEANGEVRSEVIRDRSISGYDSCRKRAVEELQQRSKNFKVTAETLFLPQIRQGDCVRINAPLGGVEGTFVVEKVTHTISGKSVGTKLECFGGIVSRLPAKFVQNAMLRLTEVTK